MTNKRSIFEEVSDDQPQAAPSKPKSTDDTRARRAVMLWLKLLFVLVFVMIVVGGLTRLTDSGLSITEWRPVTGVVPPLNDADWAGEFEKYQASPEYRLQNSGMELAAFKAIYWWEWGHRLLGRVIGMVWAVGLIWFAIRRQVPTGWWPRLVGIGVLGAIQGAIGWWMVSSGLTGRMVDVASYRLAIHLGLAFAILGLIIWYVMTLGRSEMELFQARRQRDDRLKKRASGVMHFVFLQVLLGALVAGIDAGKNFPEWPTMYGVLIPPGMFDLVPVWSNFFENPTLVQFVHRGMAYILFLYTMFAWWKSRASARVAQRRAFDWLAVMVFGQVVIGITTALTAAHIHVALTHLVLAVVVFVLAIRARFLAVYPPEQQIARG